MSTTTIIIDKSFKLDLAVSKDSNRFATNCVLVDGDRRRAVATNGMILASVPCKIKSDGTPHAETYLTVPAIKASRKVAGRKAGEIEFEANSVGEVVVTNAAELSSENFRQPRGIFPPHEKVIPKVDLDAPMVSLNSTLLKKLAEALGSDGGQVRLQFAADKDGVLLPNEPIRVTPINGGDAGGPLAPVGVIMPLKRKAK